MPFQQLPLSSISMSSAYLALGKEEEGEELFPAAYSAFY
jgi:hypothetical protein